jgi:hypothetical protein
VLPAKGRSAHGQGEANVRLIAAAPDLLAALQDLCETIEREASDVDSWAGRQLDAARAAIAKATGAAP